MNEHEIRIAAEQVLQSPDLWRVHSLAQSALDLLEALEEISSGDVWNAPRFADEVLQGRDKSDRTED